MKKLLRLRALTLPPLACAIALASGCSGEKTTAGELIVAVQTDMSLPKDVDQVRIDIRSFGNVVFKNTYPVGAGGLRIPATLGILPGTNGRALITIRVIALQRGKPRMLREVVTTVPESRLATLRLPIQWISDGSAVRPDPTNEEDIRSTCADGQTDIAGECVPWDVDSAKLPDFRDADIFGGGGADGAGGTCFDTATCLAGGTTVHFDSATCSAALPVGLGADAAKVNVGLVLPLGGDGICDATNCYIPLDANSNAGWVPGEGAPSTDKPPTDGEQPPDVVPVDAGTRVRAQAGDGTSLSGAVTTVKLPKKICDKLRTGAVNGVIVSASCASKLPTIPTCGPWSSVSGGNGGGGGSDAGTSRDDATTSACTTPDCSGTPGSGEKPSTCQCARSCGSTVWTVICDGSNCQCSSEAGSGQSFPQSTICLDIAQQHAALERCMPL